MGVEQEESANQEPAATGSSLESDDNEGEGCNTGSSVIQAWSWTRFSRFGSSSSF